MKQYFYIPMSHEALLTQVVNEWTSAPNYGWTIITGFYLPTEIDRQGNSPVVNVLRAGRQVVEIPYTQQASQFTTMQELTAFCLEGDLDLYAPDFKVLLLTLSGVRAFDTAEEYLEFIKTK